MFDDVRKKAYGALQVFQLNSFGLLINGITFNQVVFQDFIGPNTELGATHGIDPITDRNNHIKIIINNVTLDSPIPLHLNLCNFCTS